MIEIGFISSAVAAIGAAREIGKSAMEIRDFNSLAPVISKINDQLLKAQEGLLSHNTQLHALQQDNFSLQNRLREAEEKLAQRNRYTLVEISDRTYVLGLKHRKQLSGEEGAENLEPIHYICQPCFTKGIHSVLQKSVFYGAVSLRCPICKEGFRTRDMEPS